jgi:hypothetical protein
VIEIVKCPTSLARRAQSLIWTATHIVKCPTSLARRAQSLKRNSRTDLDSHKLERDLQLLNRNLYMPNGLGMFARRGEFSENLRQ